MNLLLFGLLLTVLSFITPYKVGDSMQIIDILPDFIGYLLVWFMLEKRRINKRMSGLYTATAVMTVVSFLYFLGQIKVFFADTLVGNLKILGLLLDGVTYVTANYNDLILLVAVGLLAWLHFAMLEYWEKKEEHHLQRKVCVAGMVLCGIAALGHLGATFILLPVSWHWICYPASVLAVAAAWFVMKDSQEMLTGTNEPVTERRFGVKK